MGFNDLAMSLHSFAKTVDNIPESSLKQTLRSQIKESFSILISERIKVNQAKNFKLQKQGLPSLNLTDFI